MNAGGLGNAEQALEQALTTGRLFHAWILEGGSAEGRQALARRLANRITPYAEDIHWVAPTGRSIKDEAMEYLQTRLQLKPLVGTYNVAVIEEAGTMTAKAQNRLLKTVEEPPGPCVLFLLTDNSEQLLSTVRSRCLVYRAGDPAIAGGSDEVAAAAATAGRQLLAGRKYYDFLPVIAAATGDRETAAEFLNALKIWLRDDLLEHPIGAKEWSVDRIWRAVRQIETAAKDLTYNVNPGFCVKNLLSQLMTDSPVDDWKSDIEL